MSCITGWVRDSKNKRLVRGEPNSNQEPKPKPNIERKLQEMTQERFWSDIFYPPRTALPSCFIIPNHAPNVTFKLKPHYSQMLHKFTGLRDTYLFFRKFVEVCSMMHFPNIHIDVVRMKLIPFTLKDSAKRWMYGLATNFIASWNDFARLFLRKYFLMARLLS